MTIHQIKNFLFKNTSNRQTAAKNAFWVSVGNIGSRIFRAILIIYAARVLGAEGYGVFSYVLGLAGFFTIFSDLGISNILTRDVSKNPEKEDEYFATSFGMKTVLLVISTAAIIFIAPYFSDIKAANDLLPFAALLVLFDNIRGFFNSYFRGKEQMQFEALLTVTTNVVITIVGFLILTLESTPKALTITYALSSGTGMFLGVYILRDKLKNIIKSFNNKLVKPIFNSAWPIALMAVMGNFMLSIDLVMIGYFVDETAVGLYSSSQKVLGLLYTMPAILSSSLFPMISRFVGENENNKLKEIMERGATALTLASAPIAIGGIILSQDILQFLYGGEYTPATLTFQILCLTPLLVFPGKIFSNLILAHDKQLKLAKFVGLAAVGNITLNLILIPNFNIEGSAIATVISNILYNGGAWYLSKRIINFYTIKHLKNIIISSTLMGGLALLIQLLGVHVLINIIVCIIFYFALLYLMKENTLSEIKKALPV